jgi:hypothetical protein
VSDGEVRTPEVVMLNKFYDPVTREDIPCTFHEIRQGANSLIGVADFVEPNQGIRCYVPVLVLGESRDKQFAEADWLRARSLEDAKRLVNQDQVSWINLGSGDTVEIHLPVRTSELCFLCNQEAELTVAGDTAGERWIVKCFGDCPVYEISTQAAHALRDNPHKKVEAVATIKAVATENAGQLPVIGMEWWYPVLRTSAESRE